MRIGDQSIGPGERHAVFSIGEVKTEDLAGLLSSGKIGPGRIYEIRYDMFHNRSENNLSSILEMLNRKDVDYIFKYMGTEPESYTYTKLAVIHGAPCVDVDLSMLGDIDTGSSSVINSVHLRETRPDEGMILDMLSASSDMVKIAVKYDEYDAFLEDILLVSEARRKNPRELAFIPMGKKSKMMRIISLMMVSDITYVRFKEETAAGQPTYDEIKTVFDIAGLKLL